MVHGEEEAEKARRPLPAACSSGAADHENMPSTKLDAELARRFGGVGLLAAMVAAGLCGSTVKPASLSSRAASSSTARRSPT